MIPQTPQQITDSITIANLQQQVDSLTAKVNDIGIGTGYFESIISHQQLLFTLLAGIFTLVVLIGIGVSFGWYLRRLESQLSELSLKTEAAGNLVDEVTALKSELFNTNIDTQRALWEASSRNSHMRIIWHIRYCDAFIKRGSEGFLNDVYWHFVDPKAEDNIEDEYHSMKRQLLPEFVAFINFTNIGGVKRILRKVLELAHDPKYKKMRELASEILHDIEKGVEPQ